MRTKTVASLHQKLEALRDRRALLENEQRRLAAELRDRQARTAKAAHFALGHLLLPWAAADRHRLEELLSRPAPDKTWELIRSAAELLPSNETEKDQSGDEAS